jgi:transcriptional regulator GlxA family with amidase domain
MVLLKAIPWKGPAMCREDASGSCPKDESARSIDDPIVQKALEIIWTPSPHALSVGDIARQLPVTRRTLDRRFVEATGHSVLEEINTCRLIRAKRLLDETDLPVKSVAHLAGFSSAERMRVLFVEREGMSPTVYRRRSGGLESAELGIESKHCQDDEKDPDSET